MATFEFEIGDKLFEVDADTADAAIEKMRPYLPPGFGSAQSERTAPEPAPQTYAHAEPSTFDGFMPRDAGYHQTRAPEVHPPHPSERIGYVEDVAKSGLSGLARGAAGIMGIPNLVAEGADWAAALPGRAYNKMFGSGTFENTEGMNAGVALRAQAPSLAQPSTEQIVTGMEAVFGPLHKPQTVPGQFANTLGEFAAGAPLTSGTALARVGQIVAPALTSEITGQATKDSDLEPYARMTGALAGGVAAGLASRRGAVEKTVSDTLRRDQPNVANVAADIYDEAARRGAPISRAEAMKQASARPNPLLAQIDDAERLMTEAAELGIPLTRAEALAQVSGGQTRLNDLQRIAEGQGALRGFMAQRPGQVEAAGRRAFDDIAPINTAPSAIGPAAAEAAEEVIKSRQAAINRATRPQYDAAKLERVGPQINAALIDDPLYAATLKEIRGNPALNRTIANLSDDNVAVLDLVQRRMREQAEGFRAPGQASSSNLIAGNLEDARSPIIAAAETATGSRAGVAGSYETARAMQEALRDKYLKPLMNGPLGQIMRTPKTAEAIEALFPRNPLPNSQGEIAKAVKQLERVHPRVASDLVRAHVESTFNNATRDLQSGANQFGGASFSAQLRGNRQQAENLQAAVTALHGDKVWKGFEKMLDVMAATGQRQRPGSMTSFNNEYLTTMKGGGLLRETAQAASTAGLSLSKKVRDTYDTWNLGRNTDRLAELLTDKKAAPLFRGLADSKSDKNIQFFLTRLAGEKEAIEARPSARAVGL